MPPIGRYENPCLTVELHSGVFREDARRVFGSPADTARVEVRGDHYGFPPAGGAGGGRDAAIDAIAAWLRGKGF
jgi:hypothetical protein